MTWAERGKSWDAQGLKLRVPPPLFIFLQDFCISSHLSAFSIILCMVREVSIRIELMAILYYIIIIDIIMNGWIEVI